VIEVALAHWGLLCEIKKKRVKELIRQLLEIVALARSVTNTFIASPSPACETENTVL
jgi:hypothetical protein